MSNINNPIAGLEFAQIGLVVSDIHATVKLLSNSLRIAFPKPEHVRAQDLNMTYYGKVEPGEWLTTQTYNGTFIELVQPLLSPRSWASRRKDGKRSNKCRRFDRKK